MDKEIVSNESAVNQNSSSSPRTLGRFTDAGHSVADWLEKNWGLLLGLLFVAILISAGVAGFQVYTKSQEQNVADKYFPIGQKLAALAKNNKAEWEKDFKPVADEAVTFLKGHLSSDFSRLTAVTWLGVLMDHGQLEDAKILAETFLAKLSSGAASDIFRFKAGAVIAKLGQCPKAIAVWEGIDKSSFLKDEVVFRTALCQRELGEKTKAISLLQTLVSAKGAAGMKPQVEQALRLLKSEQN